MGSTFVSGKWHLIHPARKPLGQGTSSLAVAWCGVWFTPKAQNVKNDVCEECRKAIKRQHGAVWKTALSEISRETFEVRFNEKTLPALYKERQYPQALEISTAATAPRERIVVDLTDELHEHSAGDGEGYILPPHWEGNLWEGTRFWRPKPRIKKIIEVKVGGK